MTDNEKRAHDLAVAVTAASLNPVLLSAFAAHDGTGEVSPNIYALYRKAYDSTLEALNRDYPGTHT